MKLCAFLSIAGYFEGAWRLPESDPFCNTDIEYFCDLARVAEAGGMDAVFIADGLALWGDVRRRPTGTFEPSVMAAWILRSTERIGVIITQSTTFNEPFNVARRLASLDHASAGRIGWNIVTSSSDDAARNFGQRQMPSHAERYARATEFVEVCIKLWSSWGADAIRPDKGGSWGHAERIHAIEHVGRFFRVSGPLDVPRSPQVVPLLVQAGTSPEGITLAANVADAVFIVQDDLQQCLTYSRDLQRRARAAGRRSPIAVLPGLIPVIADTAEEARQRLDHLESLMDVGLAIRELERRFGCEPGSLDPQDRLAADLPPVSEETGNQTLYRVLRDMAQQGDLTVEQVVRRMNAGRGHLMVVGTATTVAATMVAWFEAGAADGFNVIFPTLPESLERFTHDVLPLLRGSGHPRPWASTRTLRAAFDADRGYPDTA